MAWQGVTKATPALLLVLALLPCMLTEVQGQSSNSPEAPATEDETTATGLIVAGIFVFAALLLGLTIYCWRTTDPSRSPSTVYKSAFQAGGLPQAPPGQRFTTQNQQNSPRNQFFVNPLMGEEEAAPPQPKLLRYETMQFRPGRESDTDKLPVYRLEDTEREARKASVAAMRHHDSVAMNHARLAAEEEDDLGEADQGEGPPDPAGGGPELVRLVTGEFQLGRQSDTDKLPLYLAPDELPDADVAWDTGMAATEAAASPASEQPPTEDGAVQAFLGRGGGGGEPEPMAMAMAMEVELTEAAAAEPLEPLLAQPEAAALQDLLAVASH